MITLDKILYTAKAHTTGGAWLNGPSFAPALQDRAWPGKKSNRVIGVRI